MFKISEASSETPKFSDQPQFADPRGVAGGLAIFIGTIVALGILAGLTAGIDLRSVAAQDEVMPTYAQVTP